MRIQSLLLLFFLLNVSLEGFSQENERYYVFFTEKIESDFCAEEQFVAEAISRRVRQGIAWDEKDWPLHPAYVEGVTERVAHVRHQLRWFNALSVQATPAQIAQIKTLPYVDKVEKVTCRGDLAGFQKPASAAAGELDTLLTLQRQQMQADQLQAAGLRGKGVCIAVLDAGFKDVDTHPAFSHLIDNQRIVATKDFYSGKATVYRHHRHGQQVLACIAGKYGDRWIGLAPEAEFLLARTEHGLFEKPIEEDHWLAAMEWADQMGADIINSSLGYNKGYDYIDMDGQSSKASQAAEMAANKGMLVVASAGNEGNERWRYITAPADHPEVLSVGGTLPFLPYRLRFSSYGPNSKGVPKPNVSAPGYVVVPKGGDAYTTVTGTSFSSPLITGLAACLMQRYPDKSAKEIFATIEQMGHLYPYYDYSHGYGVPQAGKLFATDSTLQQSSFTADFQQGKVTLRFDPAIVADSLNHPYGRVLYYHFELPNGRLDSYEHIMVPNGARGYQFQYRPEAEGVLRIWFAGYLLERKTMNDER